MTPEQFLKLTSIRQLETVFDQGREIMGRSFLFYNIHLYSLSGFFVEVWYQQVTRKVDRIILLTMDEVLEIYDWQIDLDELMGGGK